MKVNNNLLTLNQLISNSNYTNVYNYTNSLAEQLVVGLLSKELGIIYYIGLLIISILFIVQHKLVSPDNLKNVKIASYNVNQVISIVFLIFGLVDALI